MNNQDLVSKTRDWVFTINNYTDELYERLLTQPGAISYIIIGKECGESGTEHLQGFVQFKHPVNFTHVKNHLGERAHIERRRGTVRQADEYCRKDAKFAFSGDIRGLENASGTQKLKWGNIITLAEQSKLDLIKETYPSEYIRYYKTILSLQKGNNDILSELENEWWYGPTGTGKSYALWEKFPDHYQKELNKWWDNYTGQEVVAIEEWCPKNECTASQLKIWADRYPFSAQVKGGTLQRIRPKKLIILSNYTIDQCFMNDEDRLPIKRRFKERYFPFPFNPVDHLLNMNFLDELKD